jgi:long-chain acyl-CoA synthetase
VLLHRNIIANVLQSEAWNQPVMDKVPSNEQPTSVCALPLYHIFAFTVGMMLSMRTGGKLILIPNPRDLAGVLKELSKHTFHSFPAVNTLFQRAASPQFQHSVNWKNLKVSVGGGMAVQGAVAKSGWKTGCPICEGYGLSETSPSVSCNPTTSTEFTGTIGVPLPSTYMKLLDDEGNDVPPGQPGEIAIKGPQVMAGYWQRPDETAKVMTPDGFFKSGDIGTVDERGYFKIVDRKKEVRERLHRLSERGRGRVARLTGCGMRRIGVADDKTGEAVKLVIVKKNPALTEAQVREYRRANLTGTSSRRSSSSAPTCPRRRWANLARAARQEVSVSAPGWPRPGWAPCLVLSYTRFFLTRLADHPDLHRDDAARLFPDPAGAWRPDRDHGRRAASTPLAPSLPRSSPGKPVLVHTVPSPRAAWRLRRSSPRRR